MTGPVWTGSRCSFFVDSDGQIFDFQEQLSLKFEYDNVLEYITNDLTG